MSNNELIDIILQWVADNQSDFGEWPYSEVIYPYEIEDYLQTLKTK